MLRVANFVLGPLRNNTYLITDEETGASLVIDPSFGSEQVAAYAAREQIHIDKILLTHGHNDHVAGVPALQRQYKEIPLYIRKEDNFYLKKEGDEDSDFMGMPRPFIHGPFPLAAGWGYCFIGKQYISGDRYAGAYAWKCMLLPGR